MCENKQISVMIKLFGGMEVENYDPKKGLPLQCAKKTRLAEILEALGLKKTAHILCLVDGVKAEHSQKLKDGNTISLFRPLAGG